MAGLDRNATNSKRLLRNSQRLRAGDATSSIKLDAKTMKLTSGGALATVAGIPVTNETPSGTINGSNAVFTIANPPLAGTLVVTVDGVQMLQGSDYTLSTMTITFQAGAIPQTGDWIRASYIM